MTDHAWRVGAARAHVLGWASYVDPTFRRPRHIWLLAERLMAVERGEIRRLIVMLPPRHGKSETTSVKFPAWYAGRHPDRRIILASHTATLAARFSMRARNDLAQFGPEVFGVGVNPDVSAMYRWDTYDPRLPPGTPPGGMIAAGIGGPITGHGAHLAIIDDPVKGAEDANSQTQREAVWDWYRYVLRTRLMPDAAIILVLTRWHEDDLAGRLLRTAAEDPTADQWEVLRLPAIAEEDDPLGRAPGQALWPEQYDEEALAATRASVGPYVWAALYQQRPQPAGGAVFRREWFRYWREPSPGVYELVQADGSVVRWAAERCWRFATVDLAVSLKQSADYTVVAVWAVTPHNDLLLLDLARVRVEGPDHLPLIRSMYDRWRPSFVGIERTAYQLALVQEAVRAGLPARELRPDGDKLSRALVAAARYEAGTIYHREGAPWVGELEAELLAFPRGEHDDQVDAVAYAALIVAERGAGSAEAVEALRGLSVYG